MTTDKNKPIRYLISSAIGIAFTFLSIAFFAAIMLIFKIDRAYAPFFATVSLALGAFLTSFLIAKKSGAHGYVTGLITGIAYFAAITLISMAVNGIKFGSNTVFHFIIILLASMVGGIFGVNKK